MLTELSLSNTSRILNIINEAARAYRGVIPADCYHEPYMPLEELRREIEGMTFFGWEEDGKIVGVVGYQPVKNVTLVRHAYVLPGYQKGGIGTKLLNHVKGLTKTSRLLVGTWADATWAIEFYRKNGFEPMPDKDELLRAYWDIPRRQVETSVVLGMTIKPNASA
ncbi:MAG: GNAT family N-acetyltransferase [Chloroflexi bacterium]|nr:GNAT family N-acetyltransferase [Chloroflexota bacterium]